MEEKKLCKYCKTEIPKDAKICPNCHKKQGVKIWQIVLVVLIVLCIIGTFSSGSDKSYNVDSQSQSNSQQNQSAVSETEETKPKEDFTVSDLATEEDSFSYYITGTVTNNTDEEKSYVQIIFNLYDSEGNQIGTAMDNINNLKAGGTWKFKALALESENIASYEVSEVTGF